MLSCLVLGLTFDQIMGGMSIDSAWLPQPFKSKSLLAAGRDELRDGQEEDALATARLVISKQPFSADALELLARSSVALRPEMSSASLSQAAVLGWRNNAVQAVVIESAASSNNWAIVAQRLLALSKLNGLDLVDPTIFDAGRMRDNATQIAVEFSENSLDWFKFTKWLRMNGREEGSRYLLLRTPNYQTEEECNRLGLVAGDFVRRSEVEFAAKLISSRCREYLTSPTSGLAIDQNFGDSRRGPFEWHMVPNPGVTYSISSRSGKKVVEVFNADPLPRAIAQKIVRKKDLFRNFRIISRSLDRLGSQADSLSLRFTCFEQGGNKSFTLDFAYRLPDNCEFMRVMFSLENGRSELWSDRSNAVTARTFSH